MGTNFHRFCDWNAWNTARKIAEFERYFLDLYFGPAFLAKAIIYEPKVPIFGPKYGVNFAPKKPANVVFLAYFEFIWRFCIL